MGLFSWIISLAELQKKIHQRFKLLNSSTKFLAATDSVCHCQTQVVQHYLFSSKTKSGPQVHRYHLV